MAFKLSGSGGKREWISPHKLSLLVLVKDLCRKSDETEENTECVARCRHCLSLLLLEVLQAPDMELIELCHKLKKIDTEQELHLLLMNRMETLLEEGISGVFDFFQSLDELFTGKEPALQKTSLFGLFTRRMSLLFHKMTFSQVTYFHTQLENYFDLAKAVVSDHADDLDESMESVRSSTDKDSQLNRDFQSKLCASSRQAEFFLAKQASAIESNGGAALSPVELQTRISQLLSASPDISEAHYVSYLNCLRVGEFKQAVDSLYHYFDQQQWNGTASKIAADNIDVEDERCRRFRYAALNLAALHCRFGHRQEALAALKEAIQMAQETNDHVCLEHCLVWLYRLEQEGSSQATILLDRFVARASELKLPYLTSLSMLTHTHRDALAGMPPPKVFQALSHMDVINSQNSLQDVTATAHAQHAAIWRCYGKSHVASMFSQLQLHHSSQQQHTSALDETNNDKAELQNGEATCLSLCNLATIHADKGMFDEAKEILDFCKNTFPHPSNLSKIWMMTEAILQHDKALYQGDMEQAQKAVEKMAALDDMETRFRSAINMVHKGHFAEAFPLLQRVLEDCRNKESVNEGKKSAAELQSNILLALSQLYFVSGNPLSALPHLLDCLTLSCSHYLDHTAALASLLIGQLQLVLGLPGKALVLVKSSMVQILSHGSLYIQCCAQLLLVKCHLAASSSSPDCKDKINSTLLAALPTLDDILSGFRKLEATQKIRDVLYYQARICDELGYTTERNRCAEECSQILQQQHKQDLSSALCCF